LRYTDSTPEFIVYECQVQTSMNFVMNVCAADRAWLNAVDENVLEEKKKGKLVPYNICCGPTAKRWISSQMPYLREEVGEECYQIQSMDNPYDKLLIYVSVKNLPKLEAFIKRISDEQLGPVCRQTKEVAITRADYLVIFF
uniref:PHM7_ext domain-containing protein n=1 Tax=Gongylonema pulchrum TaxID=637853 RepID=A0A183ELY0_9BILA